MKLTIEQINEMTIAQLTSTYNELTGKSLKKFTDKKTAVTRLIEAIADHEMVITEQPTVTCVTCGTVAPESDMESVKGKWYCADEDTCMIVAAAKKSAEVVEKKTSKPKTKSPSNSNRITKQTVFELKSVEEQNMSSLRTPQISKINGFFKESTQLTKGQIIDLLDNCGYKQSGEKIFAWYQKVLLETLIQIVPQNTNEA